MGIKNFVQRAVYNFGANMGVLQKQAPFIFPTNVEGVVQWQMGNFLNYTENGFALNSVIYATIMYKVRAITQAVPRAAIGDPLQPEYLPPSHPLSKLARRPNPYMSWIEMQGLLEAYLNLSGNAYLVLDRDGSKLGIPKAMYPVRPDEMFIIPNKEGLSGYLYVPKNLTINNAIPILLEDVIHVKFPNPSDTFQGLGYGLSPMASLSRSGDVDNSVTRYLKLFFDRGAMPVGLLKYDMPLDISMITAIKNRWRQIYGGVDNWTDIGVLDSGGQYQKLGQNFEEMGFEGLDERNESRIIGPFGVPPILIGTRFGLSHATYSNYEEARKAFWEDTMMYEIRLFETEIQHALMGTDGSYLVYDTSTVPALKKNIIPLVEAATKLWNMGMPLNQAILSVGLRFPQVDLGDVPYIGIDVRDAGAPLPDNQKKSLDQISLSHKAVAKLTPEQVRRNNMISSLDKLTDKWEPIFVKAARVAFEEDKRALLIIIQNIATKALETKSTIKWLNINEPYEEYLTTISPKVWTQSFVASLKGTVEDLDKIWMLNFGNKFALRNLEGEEWFQNYTLQFSEPINKTSSNKIHEIIALAQKEGWSNQQLQNEIKNHFDFWMNGPDTSKEKIWLSKGRVSLEYRAEMIARTEVTKLSNAGSQSLFKEWNVQKKEWATRFDGRQRNSHTIAHGQIVDVDKAFKVGYSFMRFPGDSGLGAPAEDFVNCRCTILPVLGDLDLFLNPPVKPIGGAFEKPFGGFSKPSDSVATAPKEPPTAPRRLEFAPIDYDANNPAPSLEEREYVNQWKEWTDDITRDQRESIRYYSGQAYQGINKYLRFPEDKDNYEEKIVKSIKNIKDSMKEIGEDIVAFRGVRNIGKVLGIPEGEFNKDFDLTQMIGKTFTDKSFVSVSIKPSEAESFAKGNDFSATLVVNLDKKTRGVYIEDISRLPYEMEMLLDTEITWIVTGVDLSAKTPQLTIRRANTDGS